MDVIIITISTAVRMKNHKTFGSYIHAFFYIKRCEMALEFEITTKFLSLSYAKIIEWCVEIPHHHH